MRVNQRETFFYYLQWVVYIAMIACGVIGFIYLFGPGEDGSPDLKKFALVGLLGLILPVFQIYRAVKKTFSKDSPSSESEYYVGPMHDTISGFPTRAWVVVFIGTIVYYAGGWFPETYAYLSSKDYYEYLDMPLTYGIYGMVGMCCLFYLFLDAWRFCWYLFLIMCTLLILAGTYEDWMRYLMHRFGPETL